ncbi:hypothetical protein [Cellvibrio fibrivorans]|uniref:Uncharacterized protein n=1 Tax=Cellvibrio fibrivorans TaxID=126350 RepID=A0ABU1USV7_9GAMM|nr:hypothetical protein [Cellvibrio fibrivorans]MDR7088228.1 hypothetical protein [Cellvibrio fibrivorans]
MSKTNNLKRSVEMFAKDLEGAFENRKFVVFLCGPSLDLASSDNAAALRKCIKEKLEAENFDVVLGEDDGLEALRKKFSGMAHDNELQFIQNHSNAVILIAASVGSFCELGLFSHQHVHANARKTDFILIMDEAYKDDVSYMNEGPAKAIDTFGGQLVHCDFSAFDTAALVDRLKTRRHVWFTSGSGALT